MDCAKIKIKKERKAINFLLHAITATRWGTKLQPVGSLKLSKTKDLTVEKMKAKWKFDLVMLKSCWNT